MDEANWLSDDNYNAPAKRVFNGDQEVLTSTYFGQGMEGKGVSLPMPPMLVLLASNNLIKDPALRSRFDVIKFPIPKKESLREYGKYLIQHDPLTLKIGKVLERRNYTSL